MVLIATWLLLVRVAHAVCPLILGLMLSTLLSAAELQLQIVDAKTRELVSARVRVRDMSGTDYLPAEATEVPIGANDRWFVSSGRTRLVVPAGRIELRVERGLEFSPYLATVTAPGDGPWSQVVALQRWIDMRERGYVCGENHLHVPVAELGPLLAAEGLDFGTSLHWWNARRFDVPAGQGFVRVLEFGKSRVPTTVFDYEIEHDWGAVYVVGQPTPLELADDKAQPNLPTLRQSHAAGALVCYQGGWSPEVLLDALLGCVDVVNICNNNFLRHAYQPRSEYSNLLNVEGFTTYADTPTGMMQMNTETYYRLLNCGLRLAAGAGSATGPKRTPVGYNRAYVRDGGASLADFLAAWRAGKNFVTNGPMIFLHVDDHQPGDTIELRADGAKLNVQVEVVSDQPITAIEVVLNGQVVAIRKPAKQKKTTFSLPLSVHEGSWIAARCTAEDPLLSDVELAAYSWGSDKRPRRPTRLRFAHTSPVYVTVDGKSTHVAKSIAEATQMLAALAGFAKDRCEGAALETLMADIAEARRTLSDGK